jgi:nucleotide-binding universal stress UspA family protein
MMYERILVLLDGSESAEQVLPYVMDIGSRTGSELFLLSVSESITSEGALSSYLDQLADEVKSELGKRHTKEGTVVRHALRKGKAANEILRYADENDVNLIGMTASGSSGEELWQLGSIAAKVIRATKRPVLLVRNRSSERPVENEGLIHRVLVPLDGSHLGESALQQIESLGKSLDIEVVLLNVVEPILLLDASGLASVALPTIKRKVKQEGVAIDYLGRIENGLRESGLTVSSELRYGSAADEIITFSIENDIDLIAMSTHGRSGIGKWVFGSVTDKVLHAGETPLLVVRPRAF